VFLDCTCLLGDELSQLLSDPFGWQVEPACGAPHSMADHGHERASELGIDRVVGLACGGRDEPAELTHYLRDLNRRYRSETYIKLIVSDLEK
jgi:hypothetical protein